jgi:hypothetical protein
MPRRSVVEVKSNQGVGEFQIQGRPDFPIEPQDQPAVATMEHLPGHLMQTFPEGSILEVHAEHDGSQVSAYAVTVHGLQRVAGQVLHRAGRLPGTDKGEIALQDGGRSVCLSEPVGH